jgi:hypothetical protein
LLLNARHLVLYTPKLQGISHLCRIDILAAALGDLHHDVGGLHHGLLEHAGLDLALDGQVKVVDDGPVGEIVLAVEGQSQVGAGDDGVVMLDDDLVGVDPLGLPLDVALDVVVGHFDGELNDGIHIDHAAERKHFFVVAFSFVLNTLSYKSCIS